MKIYVLFMEYGNYSDYSMNILGAYSSLENAQKASEILVKNNFARYDDIDISAIELELNFPSKEPSKAEMEAYGLSSNKRIDIATIIKTYEYSGDDNIDYKRTNYYD